MFQAIYNSLSGLFSFSSALDTISNNVANMNTPGFRGSDSFFADVDGGFGTHVTGVGLRTTHGTPQQTGTSTDLAINGDGFFVLRDPAGNLFYTRAGQFVFNSDGVLIDSVTHYEVMSIDASGNLSNIDETGFKTLPAQATTRVDIIGNIAASGQPTISLQPVKIIDASGAEHTWTITLTPLPQTTGATPTNPFAISIKDETGATIGGAATQNIVSYTTQTGVLSGPTTFAFNDSYGGKAQTVTLNFGIAGSQTGGSTSHPGQGPSAVAQAADGNAQIGLLTPPTFDTNGVMQFTYSSTQTKSGPQIALASFASENALQLLGGRLISGAAQKPPTLGHPGAGVFGSITGGSLEGADVDLTQEFATMIIIQRGYQASSRVMTVSNQMLEDLYNNAQGGSGG